MRRHGGDFENAMKTCPMCKSVYADNSLNFCLNDGTMLFEGDSSLPTVAFSNLPTNASDAEIPTQITRLPDLSASQPPPDRFFSPPFQFIPQISAATEPTGRSYKYPLIIVGTLIFGVIGGLLIAVGLGKWTSGNNSVTNTNSTIYGLSNSNTASNINTASNTNSNVVKNANVEVEKTPVPEFDLVGTWEGKFDTTVSTLNILNQNGKTFSGTLNRKDGYVIEFAGEINHEKRTVSMNETKILKLPKDGAWILGKNNGTISADGKSMRGKGKDKVNSYQWTFTKK